MSESKHVRPATSRIAEADEDLRPCNSTSRAVHAALMLCAAITLQACVAVDANDPSMMQSPSAMKFRETDAYAIVPAPVPGLPAGSVDATMPRASATPMRAPELWTGSRPDTRRAAASDSNYRSPEYRSPESGEPIPNDDSHDGMRGEDASSRYVLDPSHRSGDPVNAAPCRRFEAGNPAQFTLRHDNDVFFQDQGYTSGGMLEFDSPDLSRLAPHGCPGVNADGSTLRRLNDALWWLRPGGRRDSSDSAPLEAKVQQNLRLSFEHHMYTPTNYARPELQTDDRPFAAALLVGFGLHARRADRLDSTVLKLGIVGPSARGRTVQDSVHRWMGPTFGFEKPQGWSHQLHDEPVVQLIHEKIWRYRPLDFGRRAVSTRWMQDLNTHAGVSLGNYQQHVNVGTEWRIGHNLPDDFGSSPVRPRGSTNETPFALNDDGMASSPSRPAQWHAFVSVDGRWVMRDMSLDGNSDGNSHRVNRRRFVAELGIGISATHGPWKLTLGNYHRTREFDGQVTLPIYSSLAITRAF